MDKKDAKGVKFEWSFIYIILYYMYRAFCHMFKLNQLMHK
jgi:hypothetical protein